MVALVVLGGMTSLSVDVGLFYTAKLELQRAADAGALAAAQVIKTGGTPTAAFNEAVAYARSNSVTGQSLDAAAVEVLFYGRVNNTYVQNALPTRAVKVLVHRARAAGNPVRLYFAQFVGLQTVDAHAMSMAKLRPPTPEYNFVGIEGVHFGAIGAVATVNGRLVSNGDIDIGTPLGLGVGVNGDVRSYGGTTRRGIFAWVGGSTARLTDTLEYPSVSRPAACDNARIAANLDANGDFNGLGVVNVPAGTYVVRDLNLLVGLSLKLQGPVTFFVTRNVNIGVSATLLSSTSFSASNFRVRVLPGGGVFFLATILTPLNLDLYAPDSDIVIAVGVNAYTGRLIGKSLTIALPLLGSFTEDRTLSDALADLPAVSLVQ